MKQSKATQLLKELKSRKMSYKEMQNFLYNVGKDHSEKAPNGYWSTNLSNLNHSKGVIAKGKDNLYTITKQGIKNIETPFATNWKQEHENLLSRHKYLYQKYIDTIRKLERIQKVIDDEY
tara:strand:+ start:1203 stop:1562 length:360 start_codon:yes stop_codon:yes gene_type:complete